MLNKPETHEDEVTPEEALLDIRAGELPEEHPIQQEAIMIMCRLCNEPLFRRALLPFIYADREPLYSWHKQWHAEEDRKDAEREAAANSREEEEEHDELEDDELEDDEFARLRRAIGA